MNSIKVKRILEQIRARPSEDDPVLDGLIRDFKKFGESLKILYDGVGKFTQSLDLQCHGTMTMIETFAKTLSRAGHYITSDVVKYKEACNNITREDAPFSTIAKFKRDLNFNVIEPLRKHIGHYHVLLDRIERRHRLLAELKVCREALEGHIEDNADKLTKSDFDKVASLFNEFKSAKKLFEKENTNLLEWMLMINAYQEDIYDSLIQTLKCLQYEFLAGAARNIASVLPKSMEFRPLMEMTPENLLPQVQIAMMAREEKAKAKGIDHTKIQTTTRILELFDSDSEDAESAMPSNRTIPVDTLSLSLLLAQGFDEELARKALRFTNNDTQAALDWLLNPPCEDESKQSTLGDVTTSVRLPKTGKLMEKLRAYEESRRARLAKGNDSEPETANSTDTDDAVRVLKEVNVEALMSEATPQQKKKKSRDSHSSSSSESVIVSGDQKSTSSSSSSASRSVSLQKRHQRGKESSRKTATLSGKLKKMPKHVDTAEQRSRRHRSARKKQVKSSRLRHRQRQKQAEEQRDDLIGATSSSSEVSAHWQAVRHKREDRKKIDKEIESLRQRIPKRSRQRSHDTTLAAPVTITERSELRVFEPSPLPVMLAELLPIGGGLGEADASQEKGMPAKVEIENERSQKDAVEANVKPVPDRDNGVPLEEFRDLLFETSSSSSEASDASTKSKERRQDGEC